MASREELGSRKVSELQRMLEERGLDSSGKRSDLIERLLKAAQEEGDGKKEINSKLAIGSAQGPVASDDAHLLLERMRMLKERQGLEQEEIAMRARVDQEQSRIRARREQLDLEERLAQLGSPVPRAELESVRVVASDQGKSIEPSCAADALASSIQSSLLPPTSVSAFSGSVLEYRLFVKSFETRVASKTTDQGELLAYLEQYTKGRPNQIVRSCFHLGEGGYHEARRLLERDYGNPHLLIDSYVGKLRSWPRIPTGDVEGLDKLVLFLTEVQNAMLNVTMGELEHPRTLRDVVGKLPVQLRDRWLRVADGLMDGEQEGLATKCVGFKDLVKFLWKELRVLRNPVFGVNRSDGGAGDFRQGSSDPVGTQQSRHKVNAVSVCDDSSRERVGRRPKSDRRMGPVPGKARSGAVPGNSGEGLESGDGRSHSRASPDACLFCGEGHAVSECAQLRWKPHEERKAFIFKRRLCFGCLQPGHVARSCGARLSCSICGGKHATLLHRAPVEQRAATSETPPASSNVISAGVGLKGEAEVRGKSTMMPVVPVRVRGIGGKEVLTNAFLDQGSSGSFITSQLAEQLGLDMEDVSIRIDTVTGVGHEVKSGVMRGAEVSPIGSDECFSLPSLFVLHSIPVSLQDRCEGTDRNQWENLADLPMCELDAPVEVMIGSNAATLLAAREVRLPPEGVGPVGVRTCLGWYVIGPRRPGASGDSRYLVNFLRVCEPRPGSHEDLVDMFNSMYEAEFRDGSEESEQFSVNDRQWLKDVGSTVRKDGQNHYEVALPKVEVSEIPDSFPSAKRRLESLRSRFKRDSEYFDRCKAVIKSLSTDGYAVKVPEEELGGRPVWYLPHHGVQESWPEEPAAGGEVPEVEVKHSVRVCQAALAADVEGSPSDALVRHYSSLYRLKRAVAWLHRLGEVIRSGAYRRFCVARRKGLRVRKPDCRVVLELSDIQSAEKAVLRFAQSALPEYPGGLVADGPLVVKKGSSLSSLAPQMSDGLLVVGGRLSSSPSLSDRSQHPVIVPRRHPVARLLLREAHVAAGHQGRDHTLWKLRERYWIVGASSDVRKMIRSCVVCRKVNARPQEQLMASLPESRVTAGTDAFEKVGLDVFGPFLVKSGRGERKRFGLMCTCLVTRAVHVEVLNSLTADSLINAVRRISARRGAIRYVISDRGTNLVGADRTSGCSE